jgi:hypothetical protein
MAEEHEGVVGEVEEGAKRYWWAIIPLVLIGGYFFLRSRSSGSSATTTLPVVSPDTASGGSSSGFGQAAVFSLSQIQSELAKLVALASTAPATTPTTTTPTTTTPTYTPIVVTSTVNPGTYLPPVSSNPGPTQAKTPTYVQPYDPYGYTFVGLSTKTSSPPPTKVKENGTPVKAKTSNYGHDTKKTAKTPSVAYSNHGGIRRVI